MGVLPGNHHLSLLIHSIYQSMALVSGILILLWLKLSFYLLWFLVSLIANSCFRQSHFERNNALFHLLLLNTFYLGTDRNLTNVQWSQYMKYNKSEPNFLTTVRFVLVGKLTFSQLTTSKSSLNFFFTKGCNLWTSILSKLLHDNYIKLSSASWPLDTDGFGVRFTHSAGGLFAINIS